ncbi:FG-GAP repeat domain-containing protein [Pseudozobellia thermophila]|uniref:Repeat domain-containing protein n=1 Tax=Pseudozobellia thermophila TaxID=192903 RepID=A0A1M6I4W7_9FLAO|nr:VCBS repeat-containing protein [Pseudozobellia thermophila]SHJ29424.1 Repeat domain-containing protein [Pseudozobellia thermophila]
MKYLIVYGLCCLFFVSCKNESSPAPVIPEPGATGMAGQELAKIHCAACHSYVPPEELSKPIWEHDVLPAMGHRLGIFEGKAPPDSIFGSPRNAEILKKANIYPDRPLLARSDWSKIVAYYLQNAPDSLPEPRRTTKINPSLKQFKYREVAFAHRPPMTTMVKIRKNNRGLVFSDGKPNSSVISFLDRHLDVQKNMLALGSPVQFEERKDAVYLTAVGKNIFPNDFLDGSVENLQIPNNSDGQLKTVPILSRLQRPVHVAYGDVSGDGLEDLVVCEYGDQTGKLSLYTKKEGKGYASLVLKNAPGAIRAVVKDLNKDGRNDIVALMAQGDEGLFYFENQGNGSFAEKRLLSFSPLFGSQYFQILDFNGDGLDDVLYVCGDNADKTPILKKYHGIYIFIGDGQMNFEQAYFFHLNGAYHAIPEDFDGDGDIDIASISFFPDYRNSPEESFVYLENKGQFNFEAYSFPESTKGRWIVMDAGDIDGDGDTDLALGSFVYFLAKGDTTGLSKRWLGESPSVILLENMMKP